MHKSLTLLFILAMPCSADPFFGTTQSAEIPQPADIKEITTANSGIQENCGPSEQIKNIRLPVAFSQLKFIGVVKKAERFKALFTTEQHQLFEFEPDDYLMPDHIQITQIDLKSVYYINWQEDKNCLSPQQTILRL